MPVWYLLFNLSFQHVILCWFEFDKNKQFENTFKRESWFDQSFFFLFSSSRGLRWLHFNACRFNIPKGPVCSDWSALWAAWAGTAQSVSALLVFLHPPGHGWRRRLCCSHTNGSVIERLLLTSGCVQFSFDTFTIFTWHLDQLWSEKPPREFSFPTIWVL